MPIFEIELLIKAKYPIVYVVSWEEQRVEQELNAVADRIGRKLYTWTLTQGLRPQLPGEKKESSLAGELEVLALAAEAGEFNIFLLKDYHHYLKDHRVVRLLKDLAGRFRERKQTIIIVAPSQVTSGDLEKEITYIDFPLPGIEEISKVLDEAAEGVRGQEKVDPTLTADEREALVKNAQGLTLTEIESVFARSLVEHKKFDRHVILKEKQQIIRKSGLLEYYPPINKMSDVGGMECVKEWLEKRAQSFSEKARAFGLPAPKGLLLLGVPGCGKSLIAKAIAAQWSLPMLKLDVGRIFGSLVGQSEENIRRAIAIAESVAPCVLWADELEKGFAGVGSSNDSGTTSRVFATFLTWMQEKTSDVFLIATANDISALPPEMLRKGRFDEIFFVDLPEADEREAIFKIHLEKRGRPSKKFKLKPLVEASEGFNGAEIEQIIVSALFTAYDQGRELQQKDLLEETKAVSPLSVTMAEDISALRDWATTRARPASNPSPVKS